MHSLMLQYAIVELLAMFRIKNCPPHFFSFAQPPVRACAFWGLGAAQFYDFHNLHGRFPESARFHAGRTALCKNENVFPRGTLIVGRSWNPRRISPQGGRCRHLCNYENERAVFSVLHIVNRLTAWYDRLDLSDLHNPCVRRALSFFHKGACPDERNTGLVRDRCTAVSHRFLRRP